MDEFSLSNGAAQRLHLERLPVYAPKLNPDDAVWQQLKGVKLGHVCCVDLPHPHRELRDAVKRVRREAAHHPKLFPGCGALALYARVSRRRTPSAEPIYKPFPLTRRLDPSTIAAESS